MGLHSWWVWVNFSYGCKPATSFGTVYFGYSQTDCSLTLSLSIMATTGKTTFSWCPTATETQPPWQKQQSTLWTHNVYEVIPDIVDEQPRHQITRPSHFGVISNVPSTHNNSMLLSTSRQLLLCSCSNGLTLQYSDTTYNNGWLLSMHIWIYWVMSHSTQNRSFWRRSSQPISWLITQEKSEKLKQTT